jgi:glucose-1-phosphate thymidylyltransferase
MKALVLAGGRGTRLRPITHTSAKQLVPVANKPVLFYGLEAIREAGIREVGIVVSDPREMLVKDPRTGEQVTVMVNSQAEIRAAVGDGARFGIHVTYIEQEAPLGLAHAVKISAEFIGDDPFVMYLGDNLIKDGITRFVREFQAEKPDAQILLAHVKTPSDFGVAELDGDRVVRLEEKPALPKSDLALVGVYLFDPCVFEAVNAIQPSRRGELEITDAIQHLIQSGRRVRSHVITGWWKDTGKVEDLLEANRIVLADLQTEIEGMVDAESRCEGPGADRAGRHGRALAAARAAGDRRGRPDRGRLHRPVHRDRRRRRARPLRDRALDRARAQPDRERPAPHRVEPDRARRGGDCERRDAARAPAHAGDSSRVELS